MTAFIDQHLTIGHSLTYELCRCECVIDQVLINTGGTTNTVDSTIFNNHFKMPVHGKIDEQSAVNNHKLVE